MRVGSQGQTTDKGADSGGWAKRPGDRGRARPGARYRRRMEAATELVLVGLDGSDGSAAALRWAIREARALDAEVLAVHASELPYPVIAPPAGGVPVGLVSEELALEQSLRSAAEQAFVTHWTAPLERAGVRHRRLFVEGRPGDVLLEVAEREHADLVVTGRRGRGSLVAPFAGSVSQHLVHRAHLPVVVVPAPAGSR